LAIFPSSKGFCLRKSIKLSILLSQKVILSIYINSNHSNVAPTLTPPVSLATIKEKTSLHIVYDYEVHLIFLNLF